MKNNSKQFIILFFALIIIGFGIAIYQYFQLGLSLDPHKENDVWKLNMKFSISGNSSEPVKVNFAVPNLSKNDILDETITAKDFGKAISKNGNNRVAIISESSGSSNQTVLYNLIMPVNVITNPLIPPNVKQEQENIKKKYGDIDLGTLDDLNAYINKKSADAPTFVRQAILEIPENNTSAVKRILDNEKGVSPISSLTSMVITLHGIPNEILHVIPYKRSMTINPSKLPVWIAAYIDNQWQYFDAKSGDTVQPNSALILWSGSDNLVETSGGKTKIAGFSMSEQSLSQEQFQKFQQNSVQSQLYEFSLLNLPAHTQETYKIIIMIPLGVLVILVLRILIGVPTIGTFMPVLIALAFRDTTLLWGIIFFVLVVIIGLSFRRYFESLKLLTVPRLGMLLTVVVLILAGITIITNKLEFQSGLSITLFPMVILTMSIERISILWEERGPNEALTTAVGSLFSSSVIYLFIFNDTFEYIFFTFPSLLLVIMALMLLIGKYRGYRLTELVRFKSLIEKDKS
jgi:hypothetical protein